MKHVISFIIVCATMLHVMSQTLDVSREFNVIPPSPDVSLLMKQIEFSVSNFTGQPNINLPIYTIKEGSITIPITISYNGVGMRVNEYSGVVGYGWSLNAGGCISRTVYGLPDNVGSNHSHYFRGLHHIDNMTKSIRDNLLSRPTDLDYNILSPPTDYILLDGQCRLFNEGLRDVSNDVFHVNCMGMTGTFIYDQSTKMATFSSSYPLKLHDKIYFSDYPLEYNITDDRGMKYIFGTSDNIEYTKSYHKNIYSISEFKDSIKTQSAWHLDKVISITGDTIEFSYIKGRKKKVGLGISEYFYYSTRTDAETSRVSGTQSPEAEYEPLHVSEIKSKSVKVKFNYNSYNDILESIEIIRNNAQQNLLQKYELKHETINVSSSMTKMLLTKIERIGENNNNKIELYRFVYHPGNGFDLNPFQAIDHWGYYNGIDNKTLLYTPVKENFVTVGDRSPLETYTKCGILKTILYPTGGSTNFTWEQNEYSYIKNSRLIPYTTRDTTHSQMTISGKNRNVQITEINQLPDVERQLYVSYSTSIEIDMSKYIPNGLEYVLPWDEYTRVHYEYETIDLPNYPRFEIRDSNNRLIDFWYIDSDECKTTKSKFLSAGTYKLRLCNPVGFDGALINSINGFFGNGGDSGGDFGYISINVTAISEIEHTNYTKPWGGLRIAKVSSLAGNTTPIEKEYYYKDGSYLSSYSSGTIAEEPHYKSTSYKRELLLISQNSQFREETTETLGYHSHGLYSTPNGGSHIEYPEVWETYSGDSLMLRYEYDSQRYNADIVRSIIYGYIPGGSRMNTSMDHHRGNLLRKSYYKGDKIYKVEGYDYRIVEDNNTPDFCGDFYRILNVEGTTHPILGDSINGDYATCLYKLIPYNKGLSRSYTHEYLNGIDDTYEDLTADFSDTIRYAYFNSGYSDSPISNSVSSKTIKNSKGETETTYYTYLYVNNYGFVSLPETEVTVCNGKIIKAIRMEYDENNRLKSTYKIPFGVNVESRFLLGNSCETSQALLEKINIPEYSFRYDNDGNIIEISYNGIPLASYLWSYQGSHPVVEIKNIGYDEMVSQLPSALTPAILSNRCDITENELNAIRLLFPENDVVTMTYHWLVGVTSLTDSRGVVTKYNYDTFGRLNQVKDYNNYFIHQYIYNYAK
ncbi:MAG: hypothetical protein IJN66_07015 [Muribaculaceae bacterium]|nr:hypothetical protein [Muribaculaceae bacterium]